MFNKKKEFRLNKEQLEKILYILEKDHKKLGVFIRDFIQSEINKYELKNGKININQTQIK